jgi:hypothetical protein
MSSIWMGIAPTSESTRVIAMAGAGAARTLLKARLAPTPSSRRALPSLLEAIALWQGQAVRAALVADSSVTSSDTSLFRDSFPDFGSALYTLDFVEALRRPRRRDDIDGMGRFADLRQLLLFEVAR